MLILVFQFFFLWKVRIDKFGWNNGQIEIGKVFFWNWKFNALHFEEIQILHLHLIIIFALIYVVWITKLILMIVFREIAIAIAFPCSIHLMHFSPMNFKLN